MNFTEYIKNVNVYGLSDSVRASKFPMAADANKCTDKIVDRTFALGTAPTGSGHDNFLKGIIVQFDWTFTPKCSVELERYHFIDFVSSQSTMHRITRFDLDKAYIKYVDQRCIAVIKEKVKEYNLIEEVLKKETNEEKALTLKAILDELYLEILYSNPCGILLTARLTTNYQQLKTIYQQRRFHRLPEWRMFCEWCETLPRFKEFTQKS